MTTITKDFAEYTIAEYKGHFEIDVKYAPKSAKSYPAFKITYSLDEAHDWIEHEHKVNRVMKIISEFTTEMEGYSYFGSNPGIPEDSYDEVAEAIISEFKL